MVSEATKGLGMFDVNHPGSGGCPAPDLLEFGVKIIMSDDAKTLLLEGLAQRDNTPIARLDE